MKRLYNLLSWFLLSIVGISNADAQCYTQDTRLETTADIVGQQVLLYASTSDGFMNGTKLMPNIATESCVYEFEAVGRQVDGYELYRLKQVSSGKYVKDATDRLKSSSSLQQKPAKPSK